MPNLGETWSVVESSGDSSRLEGVVIAAGPTIIRLVTRTGRRLAVPVSTWDRSWTRITNAPEAGVEQTCAHCRQTAFFRHKAQGDEVWVCEDHLPHGAKAYFPGDNLTEHSPGIEMKCPWCNSDQVSLESTLEPLPDFRCATRYKCTACDCHWSPLLGRGVGDDGSILAGDLKFVLDRRPAREVRLGFISYRGLCRALGMGDVPHIAGVPVNMQESLGDSVTLILYVNGSPIVRDETPVEPPITFGHSLPDPHIVAGAPWRWRAHQHAIFGQTICRIVRADENEVTFEISGHPQVTLPLKDFLSHWSEGRRGNGLPPLHTIWIHLETKRIVQAIRPTTVQLANRQVAYVTSENKRETTPLNSFYRLYKELPMPPEHHLWALEGKVYEAVRTEQGLHMRARGSKNLESVELLDLCTKYEPIQFFSAYIEIVGELNGDDPRHGLRVGTRWARKDCETDEVIIQDLLLRSSDEFVQVLHEQDGQLVYSSLEELLASREYVSPNAPCKEGETWVSLTQPGVQVTIVTADVPPLERAVIRRNDGLEETLTHAKLTSLYRRLDIRSYWEILELEDDD